MKKEISSIELRQIVDEMQFLSDSRTDKISQAESGFYLTFYARAKGNFTLRIFPGKYLYLTKNRPESPEPSGFCLSLRKNLVNAMLKSIEQIGSERIVKLVFETKERVFFLFAELFGKGNLILCDKDNKILSLLERQEFKGKSIAVKETYDPPAKGFDVFKLSKEQFEKLSESKSGSLVKALAADFGLGGTYAEEVCILAGIDKGISPEKLSKKELESLFDSLNGLLSQKIEPAAVFDGDEIVNTVPYSLRRYKDHRSEPYNSYNDALDSTIGKHVEEERKTEAGKTQDKNIEKTKRIIEEQEKNLAKTNKLIEDNQRKGEFIYENYAVVKEILDELNRAKERYSWKEISEKLKGHKMIKSINEKEKKVVVEI